jgi:hypothetical protein
VVGAFVEGGARPARFLPLFVLIVVPLVHFLVKTLILILLFPSEGLVWLSIFF